MIEFTNKFDCCGCTACYSICHHKAIDLITDEEGFSYPQINKDICTECGLCEKVCPIIKYKSEPKIGRPTIYAAINTNQEQYMQSSSGGIFILLCQYIISQKGIICGAKYDEDFIVKHSFAKTIEECKAFQGSKYVQSDIRNIFPQIKQYLDQQLLVLFSGTPCQIAGLKLYLRKEYKNLYTVDIICHGVPSPLVFQDYLKLIKGKNDIISINMKSKSKKKGTAIKIDFRNGKSTRQTIKTDLWNKLYFNHYIIRPSCHNCQFTHYNRTGDITIGDYWDVNKYYPNFHPNQMVSLVLTNSPQGVSLFNNISNSLDFIPIKQEESLQPQLQYPTHISPKRNEFWRNYQQKGFDFIARKYLKYTLYNRIKFHIKNIVSKLL